MELFRVTTAIAGLESDLPVDVAGVVHRAPVRVFKYILTFFPIFLSLLFIILPPSMMMMVLPVLELPHTTALNSPASAISLRNSVCCLVGTAPGFPVFFLISWVMTIPAETPHCLNTRVTSEYSEKQNAMLRRVGWNALMSSISFSSFGQVQDLERHLVKPFVVHQGFL